MSQKKVNLGPDEQQEELLDINPKRPEGISINQEYLDREFDSQGSDNDIQGSNNGNTFGGSQPVDSEDDVLPRVRDRRPSVVDLEYSRLGKKRPVDFSEGNIYASDLTDDEMDLQDDAYRLYMDAKGMLGPSQRSESQGIQGANDDVAARVMDRRSGFDSLQALDSGDELVSSSNVNQDVPLVDINSEDSAELIPDYVYKSNSDINRLLANYESVRAAIPDVNNVSNVDVISSPILQIPDIQVSNMSESMVTEGSTFGGPPRFNKAKVVLSRLPTPRRTPNTYMTKNGNQAEYHDIIYIDKDGKQIDMLSLAKVVKCKSKKGDAYNYYAPNILLTPGMCRNALSHGIKISKTGRKYYKVSNDAWNIYILKQQMKNGFKNLTRAVRVGPKFNASASNAVATRTNRASYYDQNYDGVVDRVPKYKYVASTKAYDDGDAGYVDSQEGIALGAPQGYGSQYSDAALAPF